MTINASPFHRPGADAQRPTYHFTAPGGWLNDPNGIIHHRGRWHVFYQHNPDRPVWDAIQWGHVSSDDLIHWRDEPIALTPTPGGPDQDGCFSGSCVVVDGLPTIYYTGAAPYVQTQCRATSPDLITWTKDPANPLIAEPPEGVRRDDFRDPYVFWHAGQWYMVLGASLHREQGAVLLYRSPDGRAWSDRGVLHAAARTEQGRIWECPNFFPLGDHWVLVYSPWPGLGVRYVVGQFEDERFTPEREGVLDTDGSAFASLTTQGADGRWLQWSWLREQREQSHVDEGGWAGALSVLRELSLLGGDLHVWPAAEVADQRREQLLDVEGEIGTEPALSFSGAHLDLELRLPPDLEHPVCLTLRRSPDGAEHTALSYDPNARQLVLVRKRSSLDPRADTDTQRVHLALSRGEGLHLRVLLDGSVLEAYGNGRACLTSRLYPTRPDSLLGHLSAVHPTRVRLDVWRMPEHPAME